MRLLGRSAQVLIDLFVLSLAFWLAFVIRYEASLPIQVWKRLIFLWPYVVIFQYALMAPFGVHRFSWRYVGVREARQIFNAIATGTLVLLVSRLISGQLLERYRSAFYGFIPLGVIAIDFTLAFLGVAGVRILRRLMVEQRESQSRRPKDLEGIPTMLIGAGLAGVMVAREIENRPDIGLRAVGFIDDDPRKVGTTIHGVPVLGTSSQLSMLCRKHAVSQVLVTIASAPRKEIRRIVRLCEEAGLTTKIIPGIYEIIGGRVNMSRIRPVAIEDLLGREPVMLDEEAIGKVVHGRAVMVTGAGGSIGAELCRQACRFDPAELVLVEQAENNLFNIHRELIESFPALRIIPRVADICDAVRIKRIFTDHHPATIFHAAAHKHVPMMEWNAGEAIKNNVRGTRTVADLAHEFGASEFVMISTDKAVRPTSLMGASKRLAELYIQARSHRSKTKFVTVRFGNVLGSAGSVVPIFQEQIAKGGPVTVTDPAMKRYFMTIPEACQLVMQAATMGQGGEIFMLDMGEPVEIIELARDLIRLSGLRVDEDIEIRFTGIRPGEKLVEELVKAEENADRTRHPKIFVGKLQPSPFERISAQIETLLSGIDTYSADEVRARVVTIVPEYMPFQEELPAGRAQERAPQAQSQRHAALNRVGSPIPT